MLLVQEGFALITYHCLEDGELLRLLTQVILKLHELLSVAHMILLLLQSHLGLQLFNFDGLVGMKGLQLSQMLCREHANLLLLVAYDFGHLIAMLRHHLVTVLFEFHVELFGDLLDVVLGHRQQPLLLLDVAHEQLVVSLHALLQELTIFLLLM